MGGDDDLTPVQGGSREDWIDLIMKNIGILCSRKEWTASCNRDAFKLLSNQDWLDSLEHPLFLYKKTR